MASNKIQEKVRERYAEAAKSVDASCCGSDCADTSASDAFKTSDPEKFGTLLYEADDLLDVPDGAALRSCVAAYHAATPFADHSNPRR